LVASRFVGSALVAIAACKGGESTKPPAQGSGGSAIAAIDARMAEADAPAAPACVPTGALAAVVADARIRICEARRQTCITVDPATGAVAPTAFVEPPARPRLPSATIQTRDGKLAACVGDRCRDVGPRARAAIEAAKELRRDELAATVDLVALVIPAAETEIWDLPRDRPLPLTPPHVGNALAIGREIYAVSAAPSERVYGSDGKLVFELGTKGSTLVAIDDTRWAALSRDHVLSVFGDTRQRIDLVASVGYSDWEPGGALTALPGGNLAAVLVRPGEASVAMVDPARGAVYARWPLTRCP
jgi:hypothetical protein